MLSIKVSKCVWCLGDTLSKKNLNTIGFNIVWGLLTHTLYIGINIGLNFIFSSSDVLCGSGQGSIIFASFNNRKYTHFINFSLCFFKYPRWRSTQRLTLIHTIDKKEEMTNYIPMDMVISYTKNVRLLISTCIWVYM